MAQTRRADLAGKAAERAGDEGSRARWIAAGSILGALAASSCCILPLVLFGLSRFYQLDQRIAGVIPSLR